MQTNMSEQEKQITLIRANAAISEYLRHSANYSILLEEAAHGEAAIIQLLQEAGPDACDARAVTGFVITSLEILKLLKPFAKIEGQVK